MVIRHTMTLRYLPGLMQRSARKIFTFGSDYPAFWICGSRGAGKSATGERICEIYYKQKYVILDFWGSLDLENAFWCVPGKLDPDRKNDQHARAVGYPILIIHPKTTSIIPRNPLCRCGLPIASHTTETKCQRPSPLIRTITDDTPLKQIIEKAYRGRRILVFNKSFYENERDAYKVMARFLRELPPLIVQNVIPSQISMVLFFRELGNIAPSGLHNVAGGFETATKRSIQGLIREARHLRIVMIGDFQRQSDVAKSIASQRDFIFVKRTTRDLIPDDYQWIYDAILNRKAHAKFQLDYDTLYNTPSLSELRPWQSWCVFPDNFIKLIQLRQAGFKHKKPTDTWTELANCELRYLDESDINETTTAARARATLQKEAEARAKVDKLKQVQVYRREGRPWQWIAERLRWFGKDGRTPSAEACQKAYNRARRHNLLDPEELVNGNPVSTS